MDLYGNIRQLASKKGFSIKALEENAGFSNGTIRRWNKNSPSIDKVMTISDILNVPVEDLIGKESVDHAASNSITGTLAAHAADRDHKLTDDEVQRVIAYLDGIIDADQAKKDKK